MKHPRTPARRTPSHPRHLRLPPFTQTLPAPVYCRIEHMPSYGTYPLLQHTWGEFVYSFSGITEVKSADQHCLAPPHLGIWIPEGVEHTGFNDQETTHCSIYIDRRLCTKMPKHLCIVIVSPLVRALLEHLRDIRHDPQAPTHDAARNRLLRVLVDQIATCPTSGSYIPHTDHPELAAVLEALKAHPADGRSLAQLAQAFHMSERTLIRRCQQELGMSLTEWRQRLCLVAALPMLREGRSVEAVALDLGYATSSAFIAMFRRLTGASPRRFVVDTQG